MSNAAIKAALDSSVESASDLLVLVLLADHLNGKTGLCCPSIPLLAEECRCSERSIFRSLKRLEEQGHISRDSGRGVGHSNRYRIHPQGRRKKRAKPEPDSPSDEEQNLTPVSPFEDGEKVTESTPKPDASVTQKVTELVSKPDTSVTLTGSNQNLTGKEPEAAPIESAIASSLFDSPPSSLFDDDDSLLIPIVSSEKKKKNGAQKEKESDEAKEDDILRRIMAMPTVEKPPEAKEEDDEAMTDEEWEEWRKKSEEFIWAKYPKHRAKKELKADFMLLIRREVKDDELAAVGKGLGRWLSSVKWREEAGQYVPSPLKFLDEERWKCPPQPKAVPGWDY